MSHTILRGGCGCGQTRYQMTDCALIVHACHCRMCQRLSGSTNAVNILIEAEHVALWRGETFDLLEQTPSGHGQVITRCKSCYCAIWSEYRRFTKTYGVPVRFVRAGTLDTPETCPPDVHIYTESKQPHLCLGDDKPAFKAFYDLRKVWPTSSLTRITAAAARPSAPNGSKIPTQVQKGLSL